MRLSEPLLTSRLANGTYLRASAGEALWQGSASIPIGTHREQAAIEALLRLTERPGASVMLYDPRQNGPASDPTGAALSGFSPTLTLVSTDRREIGLSNLPASFVLSAGDFFAFSYGASPTRFAFHQVVTGSTANGSGSTNSNPAEVVPSIRAGFTLSAPVTLIRPTFKALIKGVQTGTGQGVLTSGASFNFTQTLR